MPNNVIKMTEFDKDNPGGKHWLNIEVKTHWSNISPEKRKASMKKHRDAYWRKRRQDLKAAKEGS